MCRKDFNVSFLLEWEPKRDIAGAPSYSTILVYFKLMYHLLTGKYTSNGLLQVSLVNVCIDPLLWLGFFSE